MCAGRRIFAHIRVTKSGEVIELDREQMLALIQTDGEMSEILMRAFILRRVQLIARGLGDVVLIGSNFCPATLGVREFLTRNGHPYTSVDLDHDDGVQELLDRFQITPEDVPVLVCRGTQVLKNPPIVRLLNVWASTKRSTRRICAMWLSSAPDRQVSRRRCTRRQKASTY